MGDAVSFVKTTLMAGWAAIRPAGQECAANASQQTPVIVPIRSLGVNHRSRIASHLMSLSPQDRYMRFGYAVQDAQIQLYADSLNFERDEIFGIFDRKLALLAVAHLAYGDAAHRQDCAEFGVSVVNKSRGRGYGARLFDHAAMHARNQGVQTLFIHALTENAAMLKIARSAGARVSREGAESEAFLRLPLRSMNSRMAEIVQERIALADYQLKRRAKRLRKEWAAWNEVRHSASQSEKDPAQ
jgi:RimJ/RimL family protein N-acetyltransferase